MIDTETVEREKGLAEAIEEAKSWEAAQAGMYEAVKQAKQYVAALKGKIDKKLFKEIAALPIEPPRWYGFCLMHPDLCIGISTPFSLLPRWRYMIKKTATVGHLIIKFAWLTFSVRW